jgi:hypothetical protein
MYQSNVKYIQRPVQASGLRYASILRVCIALPSSTSLASPEFSAMGPLRPGPERSSNLEGAAGGLGTSARNALRTIPRQTDAYVEWRRVVQPYETRMEEADITHLA